MFGRPSHQGITTSSGSGASAGERFSANYCEDSDEDLPLNDSDPDGATNFEDEENF